MKIHSLITRSKHFPLESKNFFQGIKFRRTKEIYVHMDSDAFLYRWGSSLLFN